MIHELLLRNGHRIIGIEPEVPNSTKKPDFLVKAPTGGLFYVEVVNATGETPQSKAAQRRREAALAVAYSVHCPWHLLDVRHEVAPNHPPRLKVLRARLEKWIHSLTPGQSEAKAFVWEESGFRMAIRALTRKNHKPEPGDTSVALEMGEGRSGTLGDGAERQQAAA